MKHKYQGGIITRSGYVNEVEVPCVKEYNPFHMSEDSIKANKLTSEQAGKQISRLQNPGAKCFLSAILPNI